MTSGGGEDDRWDMDPLQLAVAFAFFVGVMLVAILIHARVVNLSQISEDQQRRRLEGHLETKRRHCSCCRSSREVDSSGSPTTEASRRLKLERKIRFNKLRNTLTQRALALAAGFMAEIVIEDAIETLVPQDLGTYIKLALVLAVTILLLAHAVFRGTDSQLEHQSVSTEDGDGHGIRLSGSE